MERRAAARSELRPRGSRIPRTFRDADGRGFDPADGRRARPVAVVAMAATPIITPASLSDLVVERVGFGLVVLDRTMNVLMWNRFMQDRSGIPAADVIGRNLFDRFPELPRAWLERKLESVFRLESF